MDETYVRGLNDLRSGISKLGGAAMDETPWLVPRDAALLPHVPGGDGVLYARSRTMAAA